MAFEFLVKRKVVFNTPTLTGMREDDLLVILSQHIQLKEKLDVIFDGQKLVCNSNRSILYYQYKSEFIIKKGPALDVVYQYSLIPVFKITVIMILFAAFFSRFSMNSLLIFSAVFIILFFAFNILYINSVLKNMVLNAFAPEKFNSEEKLTDEQKEWISNPKKCPACGHEISLYNFTCPECGITVNSKKRKNSTNASNFFDMKLKYRYIPDSDSTE